MEDVLLEKNNETQQPVSGSAKKVEGSSPGNTRSSNYMALEDLMCVKAFYKASEDSILGTKQKVSIFCFKIKKC